MKRGGIINAQLAGALARLGHTDTLVICDAGLPIPRGPEIVDLAFRLGTPGFGTVLEGILEELVIEEAVAAREVERENPGCYALLASRLPELKLVPHWELKVRTADARLVVRTGEATPYSNVILRCGVPF
ncbi:D-ribose pyranase [Rubrobacter xylanophilus]|uniref:D-ribose pyranase n=1 Tax=Rubrobacter xylanophilus TaxID=49319 RepID=A0A510HGK4_9ACTN|nr:D-ribose pyranase [Rubrobacter xylanophilus]BBL78375.1 D-ribose pyranase [Rubrobacter xylanophilus]